MVNYIQQHFGVASRIITLERDFEGGGGNKRQPVGEVIKLKTLFKSNNKFLRFFTFLYDGFVLIKEAKKYRDTHIIVTTSPPMLPMWASILFSNDVKWSLWALDLFPEGFMATGIIKESNPFYKWVINKTYSSTPSSIIALGPMQGKHLEEKFGKKIDTLLLPCGVFFYQDKSKEIPTWYDANKIIIGYCGNVHDPHNPDYIKSMIDQIDAEKHLLILALYGTKAPALKEYAKNKKGVILVDNVPRNQLHFIQIHMVSLRTEWTHIAVPSKAVSAINMGCSVLFCGDKNSDNWQLLQEAAWYINEGNIDIEVKLFLETIDKKSIQDKAKKALVINEYLKKTIIDTYTKIGTGK